MAASPKAKNAARVYVTVSTVAFSAWLVLVAGKLIILAGQYISQAVLIVVHSVPVIG
jgi:hypothetical protein